MVIPARLQKETEADQQFFRISVLGCPICGDSNLNGVVGVAKQNIKCNGEAHLFCINCQSFFYFGD